MLAVVAAIELESLHQLGLPMLVVVAAYLHLHLKLLSALSVGPGKVLPMVRILSSQIYLRRAAVAAVAAFVVVLAAVSVSPSVRVSGWV